MHWMTPDELVTLGFALSRVVMMNEGHNGMLRVPRTRRVGRSILPAAHAAGCRALAMEALGSHPDGMRVLDGAPERVGYLEQPEMIEFVDAALALGWKLVAYEADFEKAPPMLQDTRRSIELDNWREEVQATNLVRAAERFDRLLVWCGNAHHRKRSLGDWTPMGVYFNERAPQIATFAIDQLVTAPLSSQRRSRYEMTPQLTATLEKMGGTAGFTRENAPPGMDVDPGYDAVLLSTDNALE